MLDEHDQRRAVVAEMHLRRWPRITAPCRIVQFVRVVADAERAEEFALVRAAVGHEGSDAPRHLEGALAQGVYFTWERHSEASTLTVFIAEPEAEPLRLREVLDWAAWMPGKVIRATRLIVVASEDLAPAVLGDLGFSEDDLITCHIAAGGTGGADEGEARIWSDFRLREDGFGEILVAANAMHPATLSRTLQRLQELGNYRNLALLGLPVAREGWGELDRIALSLDAINAALTRPEVTDDALLAQVFGLWSELIAQVSVSNYRISATEAYAAIVEERLAELRIRPCAGHMSLADFTQRRFLPAVRTCTAHRRRADALAQRTAQVVALLRTRIETRIENQNGRLLASMESSASRQLRLQQLVEGLSVVAVSYYSLAIVGKVLEGVGEVVPGLHVHLLTGLLAPAVVLAVWSAIARQKRRILGH